MSYDTQVTEMCEFLKQKFRWKRTKQEKRTDVPSASRIHHKIKAFHRASEQKIYRYVTDSRVK